MGRAGDVWGYVADEMCGQDAAGLGWIGHILSRVRQCTHRAQRAESRAVCSRETARALHYLMQVMVMMHGHAEAARILRTHVRTELRRTHHAV
jgi:hypothetical protein